MVKKFLYTLINTVSLLIIVAAVAVLVLVLFTPSGRRRRCLAIRCCVSRLGAWSRRMRLIR